MIGFTIDKTLLKELGDFYANTCFFVGKEPPLRVRKNQTNQLEKNGSARLLL